MNIIHYSIRSFFTNEYYSIIRFASKRLFVATLGWALHMLSAPPSHQTRPCSPPPGCTWVLLSDAVLRMYCVHYLSTFGWSWHSCRHHRWTCQGNRWSGSGSFWHLGVNIVSTFIFIIHCILTSFHLADSVIYPPLEAAQREERVWVGVISGQVSVLLHSVEWLQPPHLSEL